MIPDLSADGLDVVGFADGEEYAHILPGCRSVAVYASAGRLWHHVVASSERTDPLDRYVAGLTRRHRGTWAHSAVGARPFVDFRLLGEQAGLGWRSPLGLLLHPEHGPWLALRLAWFTTDELPLSVLTGDSPCVTCPAPCVQACPGGAVGSSFDLHACVATRPHHPCRTGCTARRACPVGEPYSTLQHHYHDHAPTRWAVLEAARWGATEVFATFDAQDSESVGLGIELDGQRCFLEVAGSERAEAGLARAAALHAAVRHPVLVPMLRRGPRAALFPWVDGQYGYHAGLRPRPEAVRALVDAHVAIAEAGFVSVDLHDGCLLYDGVDLHLVDVDEYRPGPFVLDGDRNPGSTRFMAPEELCRGAVLDERTTVFHMGRALQILAPGRWADVAARATLPEPGLRFGTVRALAAAL